MSQYVRRACLRTTPTKTQNLLDHQLVSIDHPEFVTQVPPIQEVFHWIKSGTFRIGAVPLYRSECLLRTRTAAANCRLAPVDGGERDNFSSWTGRLVHFHR